jgi:hypothetical protein
VRTIAIKLEFQAKFQYTVILGEGDCTEHNDQAEDASLAGGWISRSMIPTVFEFDYPSITVAPVDKTKRRFDLGRVTLNELCPPIPSSNSETKQTVAPACESTGKRREGLVVCLEMHFNRYTKNKRNSSQTMKEQYRHHSTTFSTKKSTIP